ncbi:hypothetical protein [Trinickia acidisoli]|uniref:hypothetical protein n=1 Tax=Trinickia acidisoli TaxID=2767482 RepID=UPI001A8C1A4D|nr:hypothetical protein [Trinickia acidisoli]
MNNDPRPQGHSHHHRGRSFDRLALPLCALIVVVFALSGCASMAPQSQPQPQPPIAGAPGAPLAQCVGAIEPPYGLTPISAPALLAKTVLPPEKGGLCMGLAYEVTQPLTVYRVWDSSKPWSQYGSWWSFNPPAGPRDAYRRKNEICPSWSALDRVTQCRLKPGAEVVIGPGQSAQCDAKDGNISYPPSAEMQVYVPNDNSDPSKLLVSNCVQETTWP